MSKKVLVTGVLGQDGANMCEFLLKDPSMKVFGMVRRVSNPNFVNCSGFLDHSNFQLVYGDLTDEVSISKLVREIQPDYFINFAANSFVACSWDMPLHVFDTNALGVIRCLEAIKNYQPNCRFYSAGSSEELGDVDYSPQDINHPIKPRSPYGASKAAARHIIKVYRESHNMFAVHGVLFNHEGTKRGEEFVTRKITKGVARIKNHLDTKMTIEAFEPIELGNIYSKRDWSDSEDFVEGVWLMLNQEKPKDYVLASGETHTIKEFIEKAFKAAGIRGGWVETEGRPLATIYQMSGEQYKTLVRINPKFYRPAEVALLHGDPSPAKEELGWKPKVSFDELVSKMVQWDIESSKTHVP
jgi:GDPmannose 4,6-dehydratase